MNEFLEKVIVQHKQGFTGKITVTAPGTSQLLGHVDLKDGEIYSCEIRDRDGYNAFLSLTLSSLDENYNFIVEPESYDIQKKILIPTRSIIEKAGKASNYYETKRKLRPPQNVKLRVDDNFISLGQSLHSHEFDLLCMISDYNNPKDIYKYSNLFAHEITMGLIKLREKKAIKVLR